MVFATAGRNQFSRHIYTSGTGVAGRPISAPVDQRVSVRAPLRASLSRPGRCPQATPGYSSKASAWHGAPHNGANACCAGMQLYAADSYVEGALVTLIARAYFLWTACGLTPAQAETRAQL